MASTKRWEKWIAEIAKQNGEVLIYLVVDTRHVPKESSSEKEMTKFKQFTIEGSFDPQAGHELIALIRKWCNKAKPEQKAAKKQKGRAAGRGE